MNETGIGWTGLTWNPGSGCEKESAGCKYCYAETLAERYRGTPGWPIGFDPMTRPHKLREPHKVMKSKGPQLIFVNSTSDLFLPYFLTEDENGRSYVDDVMGVIEATPDHRYQILTKHPDLAAAYFRARGSVPGNIWMGTTIERDDYTFRADHLREIDARVRFVSAEPLLSGLPSLNLDGIHQVIIGGESGSHLLDPEICAKRGLVVHTAPQATLGWEKTTAGIVRVASLINLIEHSPSPSERPAIFFKQWGGFLPGSAGKILNLKTGLTLCELPRVDGALPPGYDHTETKARRAQALDARA